MPTPAVTPSYGNWQGARVDGHETLGLSEGKNVITVATPAPEFPEVETLKAAMNDSGAVFSPEAYEEYLGEAASGVISDVPEEDGICLYATGTESAGMAHFSNVPLNYTFYMTFNFTQGREIYVATSSPAYHKIDMVYYGCLFLAQYRKSGRPESQTVIPTNPTGNGNSTIEDYGTISMPTKPYLLYTPATSEEMQGLSWVYPSEKTLNSSTHVRHRRADSAQDRPVSNKSAPRRKRWLRHGRCQRERRVLLRGHAYLTIVQGMCHSCRAAIATQQ